MIPTASSSDVPAVRLTVCVPVAVVTVNWVSALGAVYLKLHWSLVASCWTASE